MMTTGTRNQSHPVKLSERVRETSQMSRNLIRDLTAVAVAQHGGQERAANSGHPTLAISKETLSHALRGRYAASPKTLQFLADIWFSGHGQPPPWSKDAQHTCFLYLLPRLGTGCWERDTRILRFTAGVPTQETNYWDLLIVQYFLSLGDLLHGAPPSLGHHRAGTPQNDSYMRASGALQQALMQLHPTTPKKKLPAWWLLMVKLASDQFFAGSWNRPSGDAPPRPRTPELLDEFDSDVAPGLYLFFELMMSAKNYASAAKAAKNLLAVASHYKRVERFDELLSMLGRALSSGARPNPADVDLTDRARYDDDFNPARAWQQTQRLPDPPPTPPHPRHSRTSKGRRPVRKIHSIAAAGLMVVFLIAGGADPVSALNGELLKRASNPLSALNGELLKRASNPLSALNGELLTRTARSLSVLNGDLLAR